MQDHGPVRVQATRLIALNVAANPTTSLTAPRLPGEWRVTRVYADSFDVGVDFEPDRVQAQILSEPEKQRVARQWHALERVEKLSVEAELAGVIGVVHVVG